MFRKFSCTLFLSHAHLFSFFFFFVCEYKVLLSVQLSIDWLRVTYTHTHTQRFVLGCTNLIRLHNTETSNNSCLQDIDIKVGLMQWLILPSTALEDVDRLLGNVGNFLHGLTKLCVLKCRNDLLHAQSGRQQMRKCGNKHVSQKSFDKWLRAYHSVLVCNIFLSVDLTHHGHLVS